MPIVLTLDDKTRESLTSIQAFIAARKSEIRKSLFDLHLPDLNRSVNRKMASELGSTSPQMVLDTQATLERILNTGFDSEESAVKELSQILSGLGDQDAKRTNYVPINIIVRESAKKIGISTEDLRVALKDAFKEQNLSFSIAPGWQR